MHTPNRHLSFFSPPIIWLGHIVENFWAETFGKKNIQTLWKLLNGLGISVGQSCAELPIVLGRLQKSL